MLDFGGVYPKNTQCMVYLPVHLGIHLGGKNPRRKDNSWLREINSQQIISGKISSISFNDPQGKFANPKKLSWKMYENLIKVSWNLFYVFQSHLQTNGSGGRIPCTFDEGSWSSSDPWSRQVGGSKTHRSDRFGQDQTWMSNIPKNWVNLKHEGTSRCRPWVGSTTQPGCNRGQMKVYRDSLLRIYNKCIYPMDPSTA